MNKVVVKSLNTCYSVIIIEKSGKEERHIVSNNGWFPRKFWIEEFKKRR